jgi:ankyrin repeat protein
MMTQSIMDAFIARLIAGDPSVALDLLHSGADLNVGGSTGRTPLMIAASEGHNVLVKSLVACGASADAVGKKDMTALHEAASNGHGEVVVTLLDAGAKVDAVTIDGVTPLMCAAAWGYLKVVQILINHGSQSRLRDTRGATAQDIAHEKGEDAIADFLQNAG